MIYPDFAFETITQIVLFFVVSFCMTTCYYLGTNIVLQMYKKYVPFKKKVLFSFISAIGLNIFFIYLVSFINGYVSGVGTLDIGGFYSFTRIINPVAYIILYLLGIYLLGLSSYKSIKIMTLLYIFFVCGSVAIVIISMGVLPKTGDPRGWNYLRDIYILILGTSLAYIIYKILNNLIKKSKFLINIPDNIVVKSIFFEVLKNFLFCIAIYILVVFSFYAKLLNVFHYIFIFILLVGFLIATILSDYNKVYKVKLANKEEHILALNKSIDHFRGIKHDFNNILQTYSGYLAIKDYEKLKKYHERMISTTISSGMRLDVSQRISENPSFFSLLISKIEKAEERGVIFQIYLSCNMEDIYIDELDFCRIMSIFLDNAVDEAELTKSKYVNLTGQIKPDGSKLFILSNDIDNNIDAENIFLPKNTDNLDEAGEKLSQARNILHKYGNSTLNITYYKDVFTIYLELKPINS